MVFFSLLHESALISPVCLPINEPEKSNLFLKKMPFVAGWGRTQEGGKSANVLQELQLPTVPNEQCKADYDKIGKVGSEKQFDESVLCAGYREGGFIDYILIMYFMFLFVT